MSFCLIVGFVEAELKPSPASSCMFSSFCLGLFSDRISHDCVNWTYFRMESGLTDPQVPTHLRRVLLPGLKRLVRSVHSLFGLSRATVRHPGDLLPGGRVQDGKHRGCGDPAAAHVGLCPQQRRGNIQAVASAHGGGETGEAGTGGAARPQHTHGGHVPGLSLEPARLGDV